MKTGIAALVLGYVLSQFYRAFLAVLTPVLAQDLGATPEVLADASGWWFLGFAAMQLPVGAALDRVGPRLTASVLLAVGALGAAIFAMATGPGTIKLAMALIGAGCAPVLMASYYIFARVFSPAAFGTLAGVVIGIGSLGNIAASIPLSAAVEAMGWRATVWGLAAITAGVAVAIFVLVRDPEKLRHEQRGSVIDLLRIPALWPVFLLMFVCYAPPAGIRGLWIGPWYRDVFGADAAAIGWVTLAMGLAMVAGNFAYGPMERLLGSRKWVNFGGNFVLMLCLVALGFTAGQSGWLLVVLLMCIGFFGSSFPMVMAHGRAFLPPHLMGRGVALINLFGIGSAGLMQMVTGRINKALTPPADLLNSPPPSLPYTAIFWFYAALVGAGLLIYLFAQDRTD
jgi:predicted MFS family arabinose efflux permease